MRQTATNIFFYINDKSRVEILRGNLKFII